MRQMVLALAVAAVGGFMAASCGSSNNNNGDMGKDMAGTGGSPDMVVVKVNCMGMSQCVYTCASGGTDVQTCITQCSKTAKPASATKWINAVICGQDYCKGNNDMMPPKCVSPLDNMGNQSNLLCDPGDSYTKCSAMGYTSTVCAPCIEEARNFWFEDSSVDPMNPGPPTGMCAQPTSADCIGAKAACMTQFNACLNDM